MASTKWYVATIVMQCRVGKHDTGPWTCDEQVRLLRAQDENEAYAKAIKLGKGLEHSYQNAYGETVVWKFLGLSELEGLAARTMEDGTQIKTRLFQEGDPFKLVTPKEELSVFRAKHNRPRSIEELTRWG